MGELYYPWQLILKFEEKNMISMKTPWSRLLHYQISDLMLVELFGWLKIAGTIISFDQLLISKTPTS
jgi:hypothetical protein